MPFSITHLPSDGKLCQRLSWPILDQFYPPELLWQHVQTYTRKANRVRKLTVLLVLQVLICWTLLRTQTLNAVYRQLSSAERWLAEEEPEALPTRAAWTYRRKQIGVPLLRHLFRAVCVPLATQQTKGAFAFGLRLMALDGTLEDVSDTPANADYFGRLCAAATSSPYPQMRCVYLVEAGTHAIVDVIVAPCQAAETCLVRGLLRSLQPGMLVLLDRGLVSAALLQAIRARGAHVLARLPQGVFPRKEQVLRDGSYLTTLDPRSCPGWSAPMQVRIIEYWLQPAIAAQLEQVTPWRMHPNSSATNPAVKHLHRLITTLLDPLACPAKALAECYHERWEIEETIDETRQQQRLSPQPLRSKLPKLILQELYALLLAHYAVCCLRTRAAQMGQLDPDRISFTGTIQILAEAVVQSALYPSEQAQRVLLRLCADLTSPGHLLAPRRLRFNSRVVKHICTRFRRKRPEHQHLHFPHLSFAELIVLT